MGRSLFPGFFGKQCGVNAAEHDPRAAFARQASDLVPAQRIARMNANAYHVTARNRGGIDLVQRFINEMRITPA